MISLVVQGVGGALAAGESGSGQSAEKVCLLYTDLFYLF